MQNKVKILPVVFCPDHNIEDTPYFDTVHSLDNDNGDFIDYWTK
jgi:hypothetical protein